MKIKPQRNIKTDSPSISKETLSSPLGYLNVLSLKNFDVTGEPSLRF